MPYQSSSIVEPGVVIVEVSFAGVVGLVAQIIQLEHEGQVSQPPHLHLRSLTRIPAIREKY